jgi:hypothetical protein
MSRLINLYTDDGRVVVGRSSVAFPVSVNTGYSIIGGIYTGVYRPGFFPVFPLPIVIAPPWRPWKPWRPIFPVFGFGFGFGFGYGGIRSFGPLV